MSSAEFRHPLSARMPLADDRERNHSLIDWVQLASAWQPWEDAMARTGGIRSAGMAKLRICQEPLATVRTARQNLRPDNRRGRVSPYREDTIAYGVKGRRREGRSGLHIRER